MSSPVPCHPESVDGDRQVLRWVIPAGTLGFVGHVSRVPAELAVLLEDGTVDSLVAEPGAVRIRLAQGRHWRGEGARVREALGRALITSSEWVPATAGGPDDVLAAAVEQVVGSDVGAYIRSHGGGLRVLDVSDGHVTVELSGSCTHCPAAELTLSGRFESAVRELYPQLQGVTAREPERTGGRRHLGLIPLRPK